MDNNSDQLESQADDSATGAPQLTPIELRVLGALMEKQLTTPDAYPLTLNSIATACNQKSSRDPVSNYQQGDLKRALQGLVDKKFIEQEYGSRAEKYSQRFIKYLELGKKQQALLCVMMLRGPQTISELDTRTQRMCEFTNRDDLEHCVDRLCNREIPFAIRLGQQPGQRGERIGHLFSGTPSVTANHESAPQTPVTPNKQPVSISTDQSDTVELLELEVAELKTSVQSLETEISELKLQLKQLYLLTGNETEEKD